MSKIANGVRLRCECENFLSLTCVVIPSRFHFACVCFLPPRLQSKKPFKTEMKAVQVLLWGLIGTNLVHFTDAVSCSLPSFNDIVARINKDQTVQLEGSVASVVQLYYNCFQWDSSLQKVERFIVSVTLDISSPQRWLFVCLAPGSSYHVQVVSSASAVQTNSSTSNFDCGACAAAATNPCTGTVEPKEFDFRCISAFFPSLVEYSLAIHCSPT